MPTFRWKDKNIAYREQGSGELLLILPGNTSSSICHQKEMNHFSDRCNTVSIDFLGTGESDRVAEWETDWWLQGAEHAYALMAHLGYKKCVAMGTSGGAAAALLMAIYYPESIQAVIADSCVQSFTKEFVEGTIVNNRAKRSPEQIQFWSYAHGDDWEQVVGADTSMLLRFVENNPDWYGGRLNEITCPVLLTASKADHDLPDIVEQNCDMAKQIVDCRLYIHDQGGHPLMWSRPNAFRTISDQFLSTLSK